MRNVTKTVTSAIARLRSLSENVAAPPPGWARLIVSLFIGAFLLWQVSVPLTYYLGQNKFDERFAWRMFSVLGWSQRKCSVTVTETVKSPDQASVPPQDLEVIIGSFVNLLVGNRAAVVKKFLNTRCKAHPQMIRVRLVRMCPLADGSEIAAGYMELNCRTGASKGSLETP